MFVKDIHYSRTAERAVLGAALLIPRVTRRLLALPMKVEYFYDDDHKRVFKALTELEFRGTPIDLITVNHYLVNSGFKELAGSNTAYFLTKLTNDVVSDAHLDPHCGIIKQLYEDRQLISLSTQAAAGASVAKLKRLAAKIESPTRKFPIKEARYLLKRVDKELIKKTADKYGSKTITGTQPFRIQVDNIFMVYLMWLIDPTYTWTVNSGDETFTRERCLAEIPKGALLCGNRDGSTYWADPVLKFPI